MRGGEGRQRRLRGRLCRRRVRRLEVAARRVGLTRARAKPTRRQRVARISLRKSSLLALVGWSAKTRTMMRLHKRAGRPRRQHSLREDDRGALVVNTARGGEVEPRPQTARKTATTATTAPARPPHPSRPHENVAPSAQPPPRPHHLPPPPQRAHIVAHKPPHHPSPPPPHHHPAPPPPPPPQQTNKTRNSTWIATSSSSNA